MGNRQSIGKAQPNKKKRRSTKQSPKPEQTGEGSGLPQLQSENAEAQINTQTGTLPTNSQLQSPSRSLTKFEEGHLKMANWEDHLSEDERLAVDLFEAVKNEDIDKVQSLLNQRANPDHDLYWTENWKGKVRKWNVPPSSLTCACFSGNLAIIKLLVQRGQSDVDKVEGERNNTPLLIACSMGHKHVMEYFIEEAKCNTDVRDSHGYSALDYAIEKNKLDIALYLIDHNYGSSKDKNNLLCKACEKGELKLVKELIEQHNTTPKVVSDDKEQIPLQRALSNVSSNRDCVDVALNLINIGCGSTEDKAALLCGACYIGKVDAVKELVEKHQININGVNGSLALDEALRGGHLLIALHLINHGYDNDADKNKLLFRACEEGEVTVVKELVENHSIDPKVIKDNSGQSPLDRALSSESTGGGCVDVALYLINRSSTNEEDKAALLCDACSMGKLDVVKELIEKYQIDPYSIKDDSGQSPLDRVLSNTSTNGDCVNVALHLINMGCGSQKDKVALLCDACYLGKLDAVKELIEKYQMDPNETRDESGQTPLDGALENDLCVEEGAFEVAIYLMKHGCGGDSVDKQLHLLCGACRWGWLEKMKELVQLLQVNPNDVRGKGNNSLVHYASEGGHKETVQYLLETLNCAADKKNEDGNSPLDIALREATDIQNLTNASGCCDVAIYLIEHGYEVTYDNKLKLLFGACLCGKLDVVKELTLELKPHSNVRGKVDCTLLHLACCGGEKRTIQYLVKELGCDLNALDEEKSTCIHYACYGGKMEGIQYLMEDLNCVNQLGSLDKDKLTCLHVACLGGFKEVVQYLIEDLKCDNQLDMTTNDGSTPLDYAKQEGHKEVVEYLQSLELSSVQNDTANQTPDNPATPDKDIGTLYSPEPTSEMFLHHPKDVRAKPGLKVEFSVEVSKPVKSYKWLLHDEVLSDEADYSGTATKSLTIGKCLSKYKGGYKCIVTNELGEEFTSDKATLFIDGELIETDESKLLVEILRKAEVSLSTSGINIDQLADGKADITYEEMEYVLSNNPATHTISVNFKEEIRTRLKQEKLYDKAMANDQKVSLSYTKILALGPGQVGKSTFLYRLMGVMDGNILTADPSTQPQSSTGIAEMREACITYTSRTGALTSDSWQVFDESSDLQCLLDGLITLISEQIKTPKLDTVTTPDDIKGNSTADNESDIVPGHENNKVDKDNNEKQMADMIAVVAVTKLGTKASKGTSLHPGKLPTSYPLPQLSNIDEVIAEFETLQAKRKLAPNTTTFRMLFNVADIGGQPAFLEMLPSLTVGPALYLVFMKLLDGLSTRYPVLFKCRDGRGSKLCKNYTYTSEEVIFTALSSIACFGNADEEVERCITKTGDRKQTSSLALLVGTFKDKIEDESHLNDIDAKLQQQLKETDFFKSGLIYSSKFLRVNNYNAPKSEIEDHRKLLETLLEKKFRKYDIPARWLILSIHLKLLARKQNRHEVSFIDCVKLGAYLGMNREMVKVALQFLHKYIGLVMYFPKNNHLKNVVICDPQIVFTSISEVIFNIYDPSNLYITEAQHDKFVRTGCFCPQEIENIDKEHSTKKLLSLETLLHLLIHLNIVVEVPSNLSSDDFDSENHEIAEGSLKKYYFLPAVLQTAELSPVTRGENDEIQPEPLCIRFPTGYVPLGFVCALSANLIAESNFELIPFKEDGQQITYKNKIRFRYQGAFDITMMSHSKYCEFYVSRCLEGAVEFWNSECCPQIREIIRGAANRVIHSMQQGSLYKLSKGYELAFKCPYHPTSELGQEPLAKIIYDSANLPLSIMCANSMCKRKTDLTLEMKMWFGEAIATSCPYVTTEPSIVDDGIKLQANGTKPLRYQWLRNDEEVSDDDDYKGATTSELVIVGTDSHVKGGYKCRVSNKYGEQLSQAVQYNPFAKQLKHKGLEENEVKTLIDNGIDSWEVLKALAEQDLTRIGLNVGEVIKVKNLFSSPSARESGGSFDHPDFKKLKECLWDIRAKWYLLGIQLEIKHSQLEVFREKSSIDYRFLSVLDYFLHCNKPKPTKTLLEAALRSPSLNRPYLVGELPTLQTGASGKDHNLQTTSDHRRAIRLKKVVNALWDARASWKNMAIELSISSATCEVIENDHPKNTEECFAALLHEHLKDDGDPYLEQLVNVLKSQLVGREDIANDLESLISEGRLW